MLTDTIHELAVRQLADFDALTPNRMFSEPVELSIAQAYELQDELARLRQRRGEKLIGYKVGCTSAAIQRQLGISEPIFARLFDTGCHASGVRLSCRDYATPAVEAEFALRLAGDLPASPPSFEQCRQAVHDMFVVIELHHYVLHGQRPSCQELIASNGMHAGLVFTDAPRGAPPDGQPKLTIRIQSDLGAVTTKSSTKSRPIQSLRWLAGRLAERGRGLSSGQIVLTGSPMELFPLAPGSRVVVKARSKGTSWAEFIE